MPSLPNIAPQLCRAVNEPPTGPGWVHEIKHDGHRVIATVQGGLVRLWSRPGNDATKRFASIAAWLGQLPVNTAILDDEVAVPDERGVTHIDQLDAAREPERLAFFVHRCGDTRCAPVYPKCEPSVIPRS